MTDLRFHVSALTSEDEPGTTESKDWLLTRKGLCLLRRVCSVVPCVRSPTLTALINELRKRKMYGEEAKTHT